MVSPGELARLELARRYRLAADYPTASTFQRRLDPRNIETPALRLISDRLTAALRPRSRERLIVSMPPQEGKTSLTRAGVLRELGVHPDQRFVLASYGLDLARDSSRAIRDDLVQNSSWLGIRPKYGRNTVTNWGLQGFRGGIQAAAPGSALVGKPADAVVIDDPFSGAAEADNKDRRDAVWKWWSGTVANRLSTGAPVVLIMTRWHDDDLAGRLLRYSTQPWSVLTIPAQCYDPKTDPLGRAEGEFMVSAQGRDAHDWQVRKDEAGDMWWALFQGAPQPDTGKVFTRTWWQTYQQLPLTVDEHGRHWLSGFDELVQSWDFTFDDTEGSDYVVGQVWARRGSSTYLVDQIRDRMDAPSSIQAAEGLRAKWPQTGVVLVEKKANGAAVIATIAGRVPGIIAVNPTESKVIRAKAVSPFVQAGNCYIPDPRILPENTWVADWIEELAQFDKGTHDDQVDAFTQAAAWFYQPILREQAERQTRERMGTDRVYDVG